MFGEDTNIAESLKQNKVIAEKMKNDRLPHKNYSNTIHTLSTRNPTNLCTLW